MRKNFLLFLAMPWLGFAQAQIKPAIIIPTGNPIGVRYLDITPDEKYMITLSGSETNLWELSSGKPLQNYQSEHSNADMSLFSPDGKHILTGAISPSGIGNLVELWDIETKKVVKEFRAEKGYGELFCFSPDGKLLACTGTSNMVFIFDSETGALKKSFQTKGLPKRIQFFPDGRSLLLASFGCYVFDVNSGTQVTKLEVEQVNSGDDASVSKDGKWIILAAGKDIVLYDAQSYDQVRTFKGHERAVNSVSFSPDLSGFVSTSYDGTIRVWDIKSGREMLKMSSGIAVEEPLEEVKNFFDGGSGIVRYARYSPDGKRIYAAIGDRSVRIFNAGSGATERTIISHDIHFDHLFYDAGKRTLYARMRGGNQAKAININSGKVENPGVMDQLRWDQGAIKAGEMKMFISYNKNSVYFYQGEKFAGKLFFFGDKDWVFFKDGFYEGSPGGISSCFKLQGLKTTKLAGLGDPQYKPGILKQTFAN